jgi:hypothetical protein
MPELRHSKWDFGAAKAHYREDELHLRQPEGFPITPLPSTLARAYEEAAMAAAARDYSEPEFNIYEDARAGTCKATAKEDDDMIDAEACATAGEEEKDGNNGDENNEASNENDHEALSSSAIGANSGQRLDAPVDRLGRTRAAANRRKALETIQLRDPVESLAEGASKGSSKKRKRGAAQRSAQPRKQSVRK